jgi:hypothetical protein
MNQDTEVWTPWPVSWSAIWVGALAALAVGLIIGLIGTAVGAHGASRYVDWGKLQLIGIVFGVAGSFFAFAAGGWAAARVAGIQRAETAMLHAGIVWALAIPLLVAMAAFGASSLGGGWYGGLAGTPAWVAAVPPADPELARAMRNTALASVVALLIGLMGAVIGGWMASGEPMTFSYYRRRDLTARRVAVKA